MDYGNGGRRGHIKKIFRLPPDNPWFLVKRLRVLGNVRIEKGRKALTIHKPVGLLIWPRQALTREEGVNGTLRFPEKSPGENSLGGGKWGRVFVGGFKCGGYT